MPLAQWHLHIRVRGQSVVWSRTTIGCLERTGEEKRKGEQWQIVKHICTFIMSKKITTQWNNCDRREKHSPDTTGQKAHKILFLWQNFYGSFVSALRKRTSQVQPPLLRPVWPLEACGSHPQVTMSVFPGNIKHAFTWSSLVRKARSCRVGPPSHFEQSTLFGFKITNRVCSSSQNKKNICSRSNVVRSNGQYFSRLREREGKRKRERERERERERITPTSKPPHSSSLS